MNVFPIYNELAFDPTDQALTHTQSNREYGRSKKASMTRVGRKSFLFVGMVYACAGLFGYMCFLEATKPDLLKNFKVSGSSVSGIMDVLRVGFGFALIFSYPIVVWEARHMLQQELLSVKSPARSGGGGGGSVSSEYEQASGTERTSLNAEADSEAPGVPQRGPLSKGSQRLMEVETQNGKKTVAVLSHLYRNAIILPRQARYKHTSRENSKKTIVFSGEGEEHAETSWAIHFLLCACENGIIEPFIYKCDHFTKPGSGQT
jgi:hypothetical protein